MLFWPKRRLFGAFCILGVLFVGVVLFWACDDFGVTADFFCCNIRGEIVINNIVPQNTDEIRVAVSKEFPPTDILSLIFTGALPVLRDSSVSSQRVAFDLLVPQGEYAAAFAIWKEVDESFSPTDRIGVFAGEDGNPVPISITDQDSVANDVIIPIDFTNVLKTSKIEGRITYVNNDAPVTPDDWPSNTGLVALGALREIPDSFTESNFDLSTLNGIPNRFSVVDFQLVLAFDFGLPLRVEQFDYRLRMAAGEVKLVALFWLPEGSLESAIPRIQVLGIYRMANSTQPGQFVIEANETVSGIDILADFADCVECDQ